VPAQEGQEAEEAQVFEELPRRQQRQQGRQLQLSFSAFQDEQQAGVDHHPGLFALTVPPTGLNAIFIFLRFDFGAERRRRQ
jgi:hypothetical protein